MIVSAHQPFFAPFPGFFAPAVFADVLVLYDCVQFPQRATWLTRNRLKNDQGQLWLRVPVARTGLGLQRIDDVRIRRTGNWARKHRASLEAAYGRTPFAGDHLPFLDALLAHPPERLVDLNLAIVRYLAERLEVRARIVLLSELGIAEREPRLSVEVCRALGGKVFLTLRPAAKFLDRGLFAAAGIELRTVTYQSGIYPQLYGDFIQNLSAFDLLCTCGPRAPAILRRWLRPPS